MADSLMQCYERMAAASERMLGAARREDWKGLLAAEAEYAALVERARAGPADRPLAAGERRRQQDIIERLLADHAELRARLQPWLASLEALLASAGCERRLRQSYGS
jgi:flagellar protein FliT